MIREIVMRGIKGQDGSQRLTGRDIIVGRNGTGKTTRLQALGVSLLGYVPGQGKLPAETFKVASEDEMTVGLILDGFEFTRTFTRKEKIGKTGAMEVAVTQDIMVAPSRGEKNTTAREGRIAAEVGSFPVMLDFQEFLGLSDAKRREFIYSLSPIASEWTKESIEVHLRKGLLTIEVEATNPDLYGIMDKMITDAMMQFSPRFDAQQGLTAMLEWSKARQTHWRDERDNAQGAVRKLADLKNQLSETDRNIAEQKTALAQLQEQLVQIEAEFARSTERKRQFDARQRRLTELREFITCIPGEEGSIDTSDLDALVEQQRALIKDVDGSILEALANELQENRKGRVVVEADLRKAAAATFDANNEVRNLEQLLARLEQVTTGAAQTCLIDSRIGCPKDFTKAQDTFRRALSDTRAKHADLQAKEKAVWAELRKFDEQELDITERQGQASRDISAASAANEWARKAVADLEARKAARLNDAARRADQRRLHQEELARLEGEPMLVIAPLDALEIQIRGLRNQIAEGKTKLEEQERARNTLTNLKASMIDGKKAELHLLAAKALVEALGPKGLQGELVKDALGPIQEDIQALLAAMGIDRPFFFKTESETGREVFQFGWVSQSGRELNFDALSTGQQLMLLVAVLTAIVDRAKPPLRVLAIDNIENLDRQNLSAVLDGLNQMASKWDNILLAGVIDPPTEAEEWTVTNLSEEVVAHAAD